MKRRIVGAAVAAVVIATLLVLWTSGTFNSATCGQTQNAAGAYAGTACGKELKALRQGEAVIRSLQSATTEEHERLLREEGR
jgi:hypothetical protein